MNKRLRKKLHKKYLEDVVCEISLSSFWRKKLFEESADVKILISPKNLNELPEYIKYQIGRFKLQYFFYKTDEILDKDVYYDGGVFFKFEAVKFQSIWNYSFNNIGVI